MKRFLGNIFWMIFAIPFYIIALLLCAYAFIILTSIGIVFDKTQPYHYIDKLDEYVFIQVKKYLAK